MLCGCTRGSARLQRNAACAGRNSGGDRLEANARYEHHDATSTSVSMIVTCGEALIDFVPASTASGETAYVPRPGGSPFNVALTIGRLGVPAGFLGSISTDFFGTQLVTALQASAVDSRYIMRLDRPTLLAFVKLDAADAQYAFYDTGSSPQFWAPAVDLTADVTALHLSFGAFLPIDEPGASNFGRLLAVNKGRRIIAFDPNVRPTVIAGREIAYRSRLSTFFDVADIIKISTADLRWLEADKAPADAAHAWLAQGASLVVVTAGEAGSTAYTKQGGTIESPAIRVAVVDTVGAGDSFMGALLAGFEVCGVRTPAQLAAVQKETIADVVAFATRVSAATCSRAGADPPWRSDVALPAGALSR